MHMKRAIITRYMQSFRAAIHTAVPLLEASNSRGLLPSRVASVKVRTLTQEEVLLMLFQRNDRTITLFGTEVPEPRMLLDFLGFETHTKQIRLRRGTDIWPGWYDHATYYIIDLPPEKLYAPDQEVSIPDFIKAPDYEFEIACLVTKKALLTDEQEALQFFKDHCYLTILNDWSARDIQKKDSEGLGPTNSKFIIGKSIGPSIVPASKFKMDENGVLDMKMRLVFNGEERTSTNYQSIYHTHPVSGEKKAWSFPRIMTWLGRQNIAVQPGYIMGSGTVGNGCIAEFSAKVDPKTGDVIDPAKYQWLQNGDVVRFEAEGIGTLENKVKIVVSETSNKELATAK
jgi:2-keto-4-pentenoate hydratase/2-oxohepta-3-ene-1,7-dioic acid hydratase in catechol pathway